MLITSITLCSHLSCMHAVDLELTGAAGVAGDAAYKDSVAEIESL